MWVTDEYVSVQREIIPDSRSRYRKQKLYKDGTNTFVETYDAPNFRSGRGDRLHEVKAGEVNNLPLISYIYYKTVRLWWLIAARNEIYDPFDIPAGMSLIIPDIFEYHNKEIEA